MEDLCIEDLGTICSDEALGESILPWFAWLNECQRNATLGCPGLNGVGNELTTVVRSYELWTAMLCNELIQNLFQGSCFE